VHYAGRFFVDRKRSNNMKQLVTYIEPDRLGIVMSMLEEARVGQVKLRQASAPEARRAKPDSCDPSTLMLEIAVHEDRLHGAIEAIAAGGSTILLQRQA
jgi:hypothetical protein